MIILEPSLYVIEEQLWRSDCERDKFLENLLDHIEFIDRFPVGRIAWCDELETLLWENPKLLPWQQDQFFRNALVSQIYTFMCRNRVLVTVEPTPNCTTSPSLIGYPPYEDFASPTTNLLHATLTTQGSATIKLCAGKPFSEFCQSKITLHCQCHPPGGVSVIQAISEYFPLLAFPPTDYTEDSNAEAIVRRYVEACAISRGESASEFLYAPEFSKKFLKGVLKERTRFRDVIEAITRRLLKTQKDAELDGSLQDENMVGQNGVRRLRVTQSSRIHYHYPRKNSILFDEYFPEGKHDAGL